MNERLAAVWFSELSMSPKQKTALLSVFGSFGEIAEATPEQLDSMGLLTPAQIASIRSSTTEKAEKILERCEKGRIKILSYWDEFYPERLRQIDVPPSILYYRGRLPCFEEEPVIAVIGSRAHTEYGREMAEWFGYEIAQGGGLVLSGLARGLDAAAHRGALNAGKPTVAVLGCGPDIIYPKENAKLHAEMLEAGAVLSEFAPGTPPYASNFPQRNRIVSGLSLGVLVVQAARKSGALITANLALEQGRDVFAVPGNIRSPGSEGTNELIKSGAKLVTSAWDVLSEYVGRFPQKIMERIKPTPFAYTRDNKGFTELHSKIIVCLKTGEKDFDRLLEGCGCSPSELLAEITLLELDGVLERMPGNLYRLNISAYA